MSRTYLLLVGFERPYPKKKISDFFRKWCGKEQIFQIDSSMVTCEMCCSGGVCPEETMSCLYDQLKEEGFEVLETEIMCWSLHPDKAIIIST